MANSKRGEVSFHLGEGEDRKDYIFRFSLNTLCSLEESLNKPFMEIAEGWQNGKLSIVELRETVRAAIKGGVSMTPEEIGDLIEDYGITEILDKLMECFDKSALMKLSEEEEASEDPQKRRTSGAGTDSTTTPSAPE